MTVDIFDDVGDGYTIAGHIHAELEAHPLGLTVMGITELLGHDDKAEVRAWLQQMYEKNLITCSRDQTFFLWHAA